MVRKPNHEPLFWPVIAIGLSIGLLVLYVALVAR